MATLKKKINELTQKENPVLGDSIVISDSENSGRGALVEITDIKTLIGGGGGGAVDSVAGKTGAVTLDAADISETTTLKIFTSDERSKLTGIEEGAEVNDVTSVAGKTGAVTLDASDISETETLKILTATERTKLAGIAENANNYTHPASHPQSMIEGLDTALAGKANDADVVKLTGDASIGGTKTFTASPVLPTPTAGDDTTKGATTAFVTGALAGKITKWAYQEHSGGTITGEAWNIHGFVASGTLNLPKASTVPDGTQIAPMVVSGEDISINILPNAGDQILSPVGMRTSYLLRGTPSSFVCVKVTSNTWAALGAQELIKDGTPASSSASGTKGAIRFDANYFYVCTAANTWIRFAKDGSWT